MNPIRKHYEDQSLLSAAREAALDHHNGATLSAAQREALNEALDRFGPEEIYMDGELFWQG